MAFLSMGRKKLLVGLDIGSHAVKVLQLKQSKGSLTLQNIGIAQCPLGSFDGPHIADIKALANTISKLWQNLGLKEKGLAITIPGNEVMIEIPKIPYMKRSAVSPYIDANIRNFITYAPDEVFYGIDILSENREDNTTKVLIAYTRRGIVYDYEKLIALAGLDLRLVDVDYFALFNAFEATEGIPSNETVALVNIGASKTICIIIDDGVPSLARSFIIGSNELVFQLSSKFDISIEKAYGFATGSIDPSSLGGLDGDMKAMIEFFIDQISAELKNILDYFHALNQPKGVQRVFLSGGIARSSGIELYLEKNLGSPVFIFNPLASKKIKILPHIDPEYAKAIGPQMAICFGLAMREEERK
ncbi:MAG: type IV pilus assembly protein PilM [Syntrophobacterales bacterium]|nr:type IV pilus assembly protein PilM [Syntrophobacterales bacterium]